MGKCRRNLTTAKKRKKFMTIFINGKKKKVKRPPLIDGMGADDFIRHNADPIWLMQNEMYEELNSFSEDGSFIK
ncbi:MAG: hypothetical protein A2096_03950 [Spirochaetes bacterium GWF1_41_5]|nr:MAG: hypothetical protein A2096_03950 [Spirochaetes bacterium GWF1_41_5]